MPANPEAPKILSIVTGLSVPLHCMITCGAYVLSSAVKRAREDLGLLRLQADTNLLNGPCATARADQHQTAAALPRILHTSYEAVADTSSCTSEVELRSRQALALEQRVASFVGACELSLHALEHSELDRHADSDT